MEKAQKGAATLTHEARFAGAGPAHDADLLPGADRGLELLEHQLRTLLLRQALGDESFCALVFLSFNSPALNQVSESQFQF